MPVDRTLWNQRIRAHDGVELAADVILPEGSGPFPTLVLRTPYTRQRSLQNPTRYLRFVGYGYALVLVDMRGRNDSEGEEWIPFLRDPEDAYDVIEWAAAQPWSTGNIGMVGGSYEGLTQWWALLGRSKHLKCIAPLCVGSTRQLLPYNGAPMQYELWWMNLVTAKTMQYSGAPAWESQIMHTPIKTLHEQFGLSRSAWSKYVANELDTRKTSALSPQDFKQIDIPVLVGVGWWDDQTTMEAWEALQGAKSVRECRLLIGAWDHAGNLGPRPVLGGLDVSASVIDTLGYIEQFLALHLKGEETPIASKPRCRVFLTGENRWDELESWPHPNAKHTAFYLASDGDARSLRGNGRLEKAQNFAQEHDTFVYDPNTPSREMANLDVFAWADPPLDFRYLQRRMDVLVYTSEELEKPIMISGRYQLRVFVSSDRPDTDLYVGLCDVHPDGRSVGLTGFSSGGLQLRYRNGPDEELMEPRKIYEITINGAWAHHVFKAGHRVRITINSNTFPISARNAGTGHHWAEDVVLYPQTNTIYHSSDYPSQVLLPIVEQS